MIKLTTFLKFTASTLIGWFIGLNIAQIIHVGFNDTNMFYILLLISIELGILNLKTI